MLPTEDDNVQFNILLEAAQALQELEYLRTDATTLQEVFDAVQAKVKATADKMGVSFMTMERNFKDVIALAEQARAELSQMAPMDAQALMAANPNAQLISQAQSPFSAVSQTTGWTEVNAIQKEILKNEAQELKLAEATAGEINQQTVAEQKKVEARRQALALAQQELEAADKEAAAIQSQLQNFGQVKRTAQETMKYLNSFAGTQQGQSILTKFFGDYNAAQGVTNQLNTIKTAVKSLSEATGASFSQSGQIIKEQFSSIPGIVNQVNQSTSQMGKSFEEVGVRSVRSLDAIRIALGAIISMLLFQAIQAITQFFSEASKQARQLEDTLYRLGNVERSLSMEGIEISLKGLEDGITRIQKKMPIFSREDVSQLVGTLAISTKQLHLTESQILDLAEAVGVLNVRSEKQEDLSTTAQHVLSSLLTGNAKGITSLGIAFTDNVMKAKAMELGFLKAGDALSKLSENEKGQTKLAIVLESTGQELNSVSEYLDTNTAKILANKAAWGDFLAFVGQGINNLIPNVVPALEKMQKEFEAQKLKGLFTKTIATPGGFGVTFTDLGIIDKLNKGVELTTKEYERLKQVIGGLDDKEILKIFPDPSAIKNDAIREFIQSLVEVKDTATNTQAALDFQAEVDNSALDELDQKIEEIAIDAKHAKEDLAILLSQKEEDLQVKFEQKTQDIDTEYIRKGEDAAQDYANKIVDINRDADNKIADAKRDARDKEKREEEELALKLKQLREKFLMDLEDALHARDARQVLRLIKEYKFDKQAILDKAALDKKQRKEDLEEKLRDIEIERKRKLESAQIEYQQKLQDLAIAKQRELQELDLWKQREEEDLAKWYLREQEEIDRNTKNKLEKLLNGYIEEGKLHEEQQAKIHEILAKWFGENTALVDDLMVYTNSAFASMAANAAAALGTMSLLGAMGGNSYNTVGTSDSLHNSGGGGSTPTATKPLQYVPKPGGYAEGGTLLATKPTTITFGEAGAEMAQFTPLNRVGRDVGKVFGDTSGFKGASEGKLALEVMLSPDLEARIIDKSLNESANIVAKITRMKS